MQIGIVNSTILCHSPYGITHKSIWELGNPLTSPTPLLLLQVSMITVVIQFFDACLKPLGQTSLVSQILGGLVFGPSVLGHKKMLTSILFPMKGSVILKTMATFCLNFFYFICCVKMDTVTMLKTEKQAITIGISVFALTLGVPLGLAFTMINYVAMDKSLADALPVIAVSQSLTVFISISVLLAELKILNTDVGRLTLSSAMFADVVSFSMSVIMFAALQTKAAILWCAARLHGKPIDELCILCIILCVLLTALISEVIGQHFAMGPILLGLVVPEGPPLGTSLITKMETITCGFLYPIYLAVSGLQTDVFKINMKSVWIVTVIVIAGFVVKIGGVMLPGYYYNVPMKECFMIGLLLNGRGIAELTMYNIWKEGKILTEQEFALMVVSLLVINALIAPLINFLFDPSAPYHSGKRCSIQHTKRDSELRIMACIYKDENIPTMLNVIEASCASKESNVAVIALLLVEILGRSRPILVAHQPHDTLRTTKSHSPRLDNALKQYEQLNEGCAYIQSFTSISDFDTIHDDVCRIALDRRANILIMPFHKRWEIDGSVEVNNRAVQAINIKVLDRAPCSVGILIDRGILSSSPSLLIAKSTYYVAVLFIGGADDAEALAYASRMARHECVSVSVVRFLVFGEENSKDRKRDSDLVDEYRYYNVGNTRFEITEEVVKDGIEFSTSIRRMIDYFDLVIVGRGHPQSVLLRGHDQWSECPELGVIGDMLASQDFVTKASVLVVQQQRMGGRLVKHNILTNQRDQLGHDVSMDEPPRASCSISVDKYQM
ncbi:cation/H antiporter [Trifolium repens]|nr:cation/H antiporter [Trifolium repens]